MNECSLAETLFDDDEYRREFPSLQDITYLDNAGATIPSTSLLNEVSEMIKSNCFGNPHSNNPSSRLTSEQIALARQAALTFFGGERGWSIIFTSGATAAVKLLAESFPWAPSSNLLLVEESHTSVLGIREIAKAKGAKLHYTSVDSLEKVESTEGLTLQVFPLQCNFSGTNYAKKLQQCFRKRGTPHDNNFTLLDTASFAATNPLDLENLEASVGVDFAVVSFYKILGYPTGLGALLVSDRGKQILKEKRGYFGGGTVDVAVPNEDFYVPRKQFHDRMEDGTLPFLSIIALLPGLKELQKIGMQKISTWTLSLCRQLFKELSPLRHFNGTTLATIYASESDFSEGEHGSILAFNLVRSTGEFVGYSQVEKICELHNIHVRTGCFCNLGACKKFLQLTNEDIKANFREGHVCGDSVDLVNGKPTGAVRVSFGRMSRAEHVSKLVQVLKSAFLEVRPTIQVEQLPVAQQVPHLSRILLYPVKSCAPQVSDKKSGFTSWPVGDRGLSYDRHWLIVKESSAITQKRCSKLASVRPSVNCVTGELQLTSVEYGENIPVYSTTDEPIDANMLCTTRVCGDRINGETINSPEISLWLENVTGMAKLNLIKQAAVRKSEEKGSLSFANESQFVLVTLPSVAKLRLWMEERGSELAEEELSAIAERFRPNLIVDGSLAPFEEDGWQKIQIGDLLFENVGNCNRCQMICVNQKTGERSQKEPLATLALQRGSKIPFGIHLRYLGSNRAADNPSLAIGDTLKVLSKQEG